MSDDIVNRLRKGTNDGLRAWDWMREAADEITCLRADLAAVTAERDRMREALKPLAGMDVELLDENKKPTGIHAFDAWHSGQVVFDIGKDRKITVNDLRRARAALEGVTEPPTGDSNA